MKKIKIIIITCLIIGLVVFIVNRCMYLFGAEKLTSFQSFADICTIKNCSEEEQENIENTLKTMMVETDDVLYFDANNELKNKSIVEVDNRIKYDLQTVRNTFYGYNIATALKIDFDNKKYDAYMYEVSKKIASLDDIHERVDYLYYYSMYVYYKNLKQGQPIHISKNDKKIVEKTIDKVIAQIKKNNMNADDLIMLERTLEIFSTFAPENEITLSRIEVYYIKKYLKKILKEKDMVESTNFMYIYHSAHLLNLDIIAQSDIELAKTSFMENINKSDLVTIGQYFERCQMIFNDEQISEIKKILMDLRSKNAVMPGITGYGIMDGILYYDLQSIGYGNNEM